ncbi:hypothetical protein BLNAU_12233 [Blattamonas nauphoetae]|uniref:EF-hand domain-containing protein n=1 Tax=Blattamonas nauphoetae TaxID=2049346 RepID=A0ABQ9XRC0_9EUKA|nr:hypothetical protein BLNAU_12233 [Blattamonas nauphoetae]
MAHSSLTEEQKSNASSLFKMIDTDRDGLITKEQAFQAWKLLGYEPNEQVSEELKSNTYGINLQKYLEVLALCMNQTSFEDRIRHIFRIIAGTQGNTISKRQLQNALSMVTIDLTDDMFLDLFEQMANDDDEEITYEDFLAFLRQNGDYIFY